MNKILLTHNKIEKQNIDKNIEIKLTKAKNKMGVMNLKIKITKDTDLYIEYNSDTETKYNITILILSNVKCNIYEIRKKEKYKISTMYNIGKNSKLNVYKINDITSIREINSIYLKGQNAKINYLLKTITKKEEKYDITVYHQNQKTVSNIIVNGVNLKGKIEFNLSSFIDKNIKGCTLNQNGRIINLCDNKCQINPQLFIDEDDVSATHSAHIGKFNEEELFYLMSRGIRKSQAEKLIIKGFLNQGLPYKKDIEKIIEKYWR